MAKRIRLVTSNSQWGHEVEISGGRLTLYWQMGHIGMMERFRVLTPVETQNLLKYLIEHQAEFAPDQFMPNQ